MNITKSSYSKDDFYEDLRPLIRLKEPDYQFVATKGEEDFFVSPFAVLQEKIEKEYRKQSN